MNSEQETVFLEQEYGEAKQVKVMARKIAETFLFFSVSLSFGVGVWQVRANINRNNT